jgi:hypothetical protein
MKVFERKSETLAFTGVFVVYLLLRIVAWGNASDLEDHDSTALLRAIEQIAQFDWQVFLNINPDMTPVYPGFSALFSVFAPSVEGAARACSLFFSCLLFAAVIGVGRHYASSFEIGIGVAILAFNPFMIRLSYSVLTEPSFIAVIYLGLWFFLAQYKTPKIWSAVGLAVIFGLSFLNRIEGILYLAAIPALQLSHFLFDRERKYDAKFLALWSAVFILTFTALSAPQVWRVSEKMGSFSLNGRTVWSAVMAAPDGKSYDEKIYGLDESPAQTNLDYFQEHPEGVARLSSSFNPADYIRIVTRNLDDLSQNRVGQLIGFIVLMFFGIGLLAVYRAGKYFECFVVVSFIAIGLFAPLLHNVVLRHIAVIAPMVMLVAGIGIVRTSRTIFRG